MAFAVTIVAAYLPVIARRFTGSTTVIGVLIAGEGLMALWVPLLVGTWSDRVRARGGSRLPFVALGAPLAAAGVVAMGLLRSLASLGALVALFYAVYYFAYEPYRALYPDLLSAEQAGRAQGSQAVFRGVGTFLALAGGGVLLSTWRELPFLVSAVLLVVTVLALVLGLPRLVRRKRTHDIPHVRELQAALREVRTKVPALLRGHPELRLYVLANCLWELSLGALKTFVVLYVTKGLGFSLDEASLIIGAVAAVILVGAVASGKVADRVGIARTMQWGACVYAIALLVPVLTTDHAALIAAVPLIAFGGGMTMTLSYALLIPLMPRDMHGLLTGFYSMSRGIGLMLGPLLGGAAIQLLQGEFRSTQGYAAVWIVTSAALFASMPVLLAMRRRQARGGVEVRHDAGSPAPSATA